MIGPKSKDRICLNPDCLDYRKRNAGNIIKKGFNAKGNQMFKCKTCSVRFPETKGTVFYNRHLTEEQIIMISKCKEMLDDHLDLYQCYTNFIRNHSALRIKTPKGIRNIERTPCMAERITKHPWTWKEFLMFKTGHET
ncbi:MAG: hypothetical protein WBE22_04445 [Halobacteriota archaeon]